MMNKDLSARLYSNLSRTVILEALLNWLKQIYYNITDSKRIAKKNSFTGVFQDMVQVCDCTKQSQLK